MKKGEIYEGYVREIEFPNKGLVEVEGETIKTVVKGVVPGQTILFRCTKKRSDKAEGIFIKTVTKSPDEIDTVCPHYPVCGGCSYVTLPYEKQLALKESQLVKILKPVVERWQPGTFDGAFEGVNGSPVQNEYRNKMEFSFGDSSKGGELELGQHKRGSFYDVITVKDCDIADSDYRAILNETVSYFRSKETPYFHKISHEGYLRHLLIRKTAKTSEILVDLITSSQKPVDPICTEKGLIEDWLDAILALKLKGKLMGVLHTVNDSLSDVVINEGTEILYGQDYITEECLGLKFKISPFSFFQTNTYSAEVLYDKARSYINSDLKDKTVFDLYSGTGTIAQLIAPVAGKVVGVEIVEEAVEAARENAKLNGLNNCEFIAGDVLKVLDEITDKPDYIILDPPRDGVHPKALRKIINYGVDNIIYISCKPTSLARDLETLLGLGYKVERIAGQDQFPRTVHVETVVLMSKVK